ncbi:MAG: alpha-L-fucosidase [Bacteroidota bacterium]
MRNVLLITVSFVLTFSGVHGQESRESRDKRMKWWRDATFGMFIHWGAYAVPAGEYNGKEVKGLGEWIMHEGRIPASDYEQYVKAFNPVRFNAEEWVRVAKDAGVKYIVITSKHHDGFGLWDSKVSDYDVMDAAPFKRDILRELTEACNKAGIKMCFYHSIMDWHQPDAKSVDYAMHQQTVSPDFARYRETYLKPQLKELMTNYKPAVMWFDGEWIPEWTEPQGKDLYRFLMDLDPNLIINNRIGKGRGGMGGMNKYKDAAGDFGTPEQEILEGTSDYDWETCMTMNDTWGFKKNDHNWKTSQVLIDQLIDVAAKGGNYLLNIGPTAAGEIPAESVERLKAIGDWMRLNSEAIYGTGSRKQYKEGDHIRFTVSADGKSTYVIFNKSEGGVVKFSSITPVKGSGITLLGHKGKLAWKSDQGVTTVTLPSSLPGSIAWVLKVTTVK